MQNWLALTQSNLLSLNSTNHRIEQQGCSRGGFVATKGDICHGAMLWDFDLFYEQKRNIYPFLSLPREKGISMPRHIG